jgi:hypothetical protein
VITEAALPGIVLAPGQKMRKLFDSKGGVKGLYLLLTASGGIAWRLRFRRLGKEYLRSLGPWPEVSLAEARQKAQELRGLLKRGMDPGAVRTTPAARLTPEERMCRERERDRKRYTENARGRTRSRDRARERNGVVLPAHPAPAACECCGGPPRGGAQGLVPDHCHRSGVPRGWLCSICNTALGLLGDDLIGIEQMRGYLMKYSAFAWMEDERGPVTALESG